MSNPPEFTEMEWNIIGSMWNCINSAFRQTSRIFEDPWVMAEGDYLTNLDHSRQNLYATGMLWCLMDGPEDSETPKQHWLRENFPTLFRNRGRILKMNESAKIKEELDTLWKLMRERLT